MNFTGSLVLRDHHWFGPEAVSVKSAGTSVDIFQVLLPKKQQDEGMASLKRSSQTDEKIFGSWCTRDQQLQRSTRREKVCSLKFEHEQASEDLRET